MRYVDLVASGMAQSPGKVALIEDCGAHLTYEQLDERTARLGGALRGAGLVPGDRVGVLAFNEIEVTEVQAACMRSGFNAVPLNARLTAPELGFILSDAELSLIIVGRALEELAAAAVKAAGVSLPSLRLGSGAGESYDEFLGSGAIDPDGDPTDPTLPVVTLYTSGTTGRPKGAVIDRLGLSARIFQGAIDLRSRRDDVWLQALPMFHIASVCTYATLARGGTSVQLSTFTPAEFLRLLDTYECTATGLVPTLIELLLREPEVASVSRDQFRLIVYGGAPISPSVLKKAMDVFGCDFAQMYGQTEAGILTLLQPEDHVVDDEDALSSAGTAACSWEVAILGQDDRPIPNGEIGEVVGRGPGVMVQYWNRPDATSETLRNGWIHTGDMGFKDDRGMVHIVDRRNDMIITSGENVYQREVELALLECPGVRDVAVVGAPGEVWGERVVAFIVGESSVQELEAWARERLARYKVPRTWKWVSELPRTATGKVAKGTLREWLD